MGEELEYLSIVKVLEDWIIEFQENEQELDASSEILLLQDVIELINNTLNTDKRVNSEDFITYCLESSGYDYKSLSTDELEDVELFIKSIRDCMVNYLTDGV